MVLIPIPPNRLKRRTANPTEFKAALPARHMIASAALFDPPPAYSVRAAFPNLRHEVFAGLFLLVTDGSREGV
jgi:hypothetical protein